VPIDRTHLPVDAKKVPESLVNFDHLWLLAHRLGIGLWVLVGLFLMLELSFCFVLIYNILLWNIAAQINVTWCDHRGSYQNRILGYGGKSLRSRHFGARTWLGEIRKNVGATRLLKRNLKKNPSTICVRISLFLQVWHTAPSPRPHAEPPHQGLYLWYGCFHQCTASWPLNYIYPWQRHRNSLGYDATGSACFLLVFWHSFIIGLVGLRMRKHSSVHTAVSSLHWCSGWSVSHNYCISTRCINRSVHRVVQVEFRVENSWASEFQ